MRLLGMFLFAGIVGTTLGCSGDTHQPPDFGGEDGKRIADLVDRMNDESNSVSRLRTTFAAGTKIGKAEVTKYPRCRYDLTGQVAVNGSTATGSVMIEPNAGGTPVAKEWTFVKEGENWKIKTAPLP